MALKFQPVTLAGDSPDRDATLVFEDGRLLAVLSHLSEIHADLSGHWFIEAAFAEVPRQQAETFESIEKFEEWLTEGR